MLDSVITGTEITLVSFLVCMAVSLVLGLGIALLCMYKSSYTQSFIITLAMLPAVVQIIIMLVNGTIAPASPWRVPSDWFGSAPRRVRPRRSE